MDNKLSIIVPVYNVALYLDRCLHSIEPLIQRGHEIIIVNDGSTDNSKHIIDKYCSKYPEIIYIYQENQGLSAARNSGLKYASGNYIWFIDSDDYLDLYNYFILEDAISSNNDIIVFGRVEVYKEGNISVPTKLTKTKYRTGIEYFCENIQKGTFRTNVWDKIISSKLIKDYDLRFENGLLYEDMLFSLMMFMYAENVEVLPIFPYHYICNNNSSITKQIREKDLDVLIFVEKANAFMKSQKSSFNDNAWEFQLLIFNWVSSCLLNKYVYLSFNDDKARKIFDEAIRNEYFRKSIAFCLKHKVGFRRRFFAYLLTYSTTLYKIVLLLSLQVQKVLRIIKAKKIKAYHETV